MNYDITTGLNFAVSSIIDLILFCFDFLNSIKFAGVSLLSYIVVVLILSAVFPIIFSIVRSDVRTSKREAREARRAASKKSSDSEVS